MKVPDKITTKTLPALGYRSSNDRILIPILKFIDFIDSKNAPTINYLKFRKKRTSKVTMSNAIKTAYADLFEKCHDACTEDRVTLQRYFGKFVTAERELVLTIETFKTLCRFSDLSEAPDQSDLFFKIGGEELAKGGFVLHIPRGVSLTLNVSFSLPLTNDPTVYDNILGAVKKNLLGKDKESQV
jgi:hypothetical protein